MTPPEPEESERLITLSTTPKPTTSTTAPASTARLCQRFGAPACCFLGGDTRLLLRERLNGRSPAHARPPISEEETLQKRGRSAPSGTLRRANEEPCRGEQQHDQWPDLDERHSRRTDRARPVERLPWVISDAGAREPDHYDYDHQ